MNAYMNVVRSYKQNDIDTSSPLRLVVLLYDGAIRFFQLSEKAYSEGDTGKARMYICEQKKLFWNFLVRSILKREEKLPKILLTFIVLLSDIARR